MSNKFREDESSMEDGINNNTYRLLFSDYYNLPEEERGSYENYIALNTIDLFTKFEEKKLFAKLLKLFYKIQQIDLDHIRFNDEIKQYEYRNHDLIITFNKISNHLNDDRLIKELNSNKRYGKCHSRSIDISQCIDDAKVVTGYITIGHTKIIHSIIEYKYCEKMIVLDWTRNLSIPKEKYIQLTNFVEITSIDNNKILGDLYMLEWLNMGDKSYLIFRDELIRDVERNPQIFFSNENSELEDEENDTRKLR